MKRTIIVTLGLLALTGCSVLKAPSPLEEIPKEMTDSFIVEKLAEVSFKEKDKDLNISKWDFTKDYSRCFSPTGEPDKRIDGSTVDVYLNYTSNQEMKPDFKYLFGRIVLHYKNVKNVWTIDSIDSSDLRTYIVKLGEDKGFVKKWGQSCKYFVRLPKSKQ